MRAGFVALETIAFIVHSSWRFTTPSPLNESSAEYNSTCGLCEDSATACTACGAQASPVLKQSRDIADRVQHSCAVAKKYFDKEVPDISMRCRTGRSSLLSPDS